MEAQQLNQETIEQIKERLVKTYNPREIYLLEPERSDTIDVGILIVVEGKDIEHYDLMKAGHKALVSVKFAKSILVYTQEEFDEYSEDPSTFSYSIKHYGKRIYARA
jgi:restriction endonuclease S subunit